MRQPNDAALDPPDYPTRPDLAVTALVYLLARFPLQPCAHAADAILSHLLLVADDARQPDELRKVARQLCADWRRLMAGAAAEAADVLH